MSVNLKNAFLLDHSIRALFALRNFGPRQLTTENTGQKAAIFLFLLSLHCSNHKKENEIWIWHLYSSKSAVFHFQNYYRFQTRKETAWISNQIFTLESQQLKKTASSCAQQNTNTLLIKQTSSHNTHFLCPISLSTYITQQYKSKFSYTSVYPELMRL